MFMSPAGLGEGKIPPGICVSCATEKASAAIFVDMSGPPYPGRAVPLSKTVVANALRGKTARARTRAQAALTRYFKTSPNEPLTPRPAQKEKHDSRQPSIRYTRQVNRGVLHRVGWPSRPC